MSYFDGTLLSNGFTVIETPTDTNNNTGLYLIQNSVGVQYYETLAQLNANYNIIGTNLNGGGGTGGSSGSSSGGSSTSVIGSPAIYVPASQSAAFVVSAVASSSVVRLTNQSASGMQGLVTGYDNASTTSGRVIFNLQPDSGQVIEIGFLANYGITLGFNGGSTNSDYGLSLTSDQGATALSTGYPFVPLPASTSGTFVAASTSGHITRILNNSANPQGCTLTGFDNASTAAGKLLFNIVNAGPGQSYPIYQAMASGCTIQITNGPTNTDYPVNIGLTTT